MSSLTELVTPIEVSRLLLLLLVAAAAVVSVATTGTVSHFSGGFAAGAGSVFLVSFLKNPRSAPPPGDGKDGP